MDSLLQQLMLQDHLEKFQYLYIIVSRKHISQVLDLIRQYNPRAFYTIEDIRFVSKTLPYNPEDKNFWDKTLMKE